MRKQFYIYFLLSICVNAQDTNWIHLPEFKGYVYDKETSKPLTGVRVSIASKMIVKIPEDSHDYGGGREVKTDSNGYFAIQSIDANIYDAWFMFMGYYNVTFTGIEIRENASIEKKIHLVKMKETDDRSNPQYFDLINMKIQGKWKSRSGADTIEFKDFYEYIDHIYLNTSKYPIRSVTNYKIKNNIIYINNGEQHENIFGWFSESLPRLVIIEKESGIVIKSYKRRWLFFRRTFNKIKDEKK